MDGFLLNIILSFIVGSIWITLTTIIAERSGTRLGGLIGGLPSTMVVAFLFIGLTKGDVAVFDGTVMVPIIEGVDFILIILISIISSRNFWLGILAGLVAWAALSYVSLLLNPSLVISLIALILIASLAFIYFNNQARYKSRPGINARYNLRQVSFRAFFGGSIIVIAVLAANFSGPILGGIFATFPAVFLSTLILLYLQNGMDFTGATMKSMVISSAITTTTFAIVLRYTVISFGIIYSIIIAYVASLVAAYLAYYAVTEKLK